MISKQKLHLFSLGGLYRNRSVMFCIRIKNAEFEKQYNDRQRLDPFFE